MTSNKYGRPDNPLEEDQTGDPFSSLKTDSEAAAAAVDPQQGEAGQTQQEVPVAAEQEKNELKDRLLRLSAEFDNYKKRMDRQWSEFKKYAHEILIKDLLSAVDNLERAVEAAGPDKAQDDGLMTGVNLTLAEILKIFERFGVTQIRSKGEKFDPTYHQAVSTQEVEDAEDNIVLEEFQKGYLIHDRLLRPAMVLVSKKQ